MSLIWTAIAFASLLWTMHNAETHIQTTSLAQARMALAKDKMYRVWISHLGGFYTSVDNVKPNVHLSHIPDRDITDNYGRKMTLVNPAYMTRLVYEFSKDSTPVRTHLISNKVLNPINKPVGWEVDALKKILTGKKEVYSFERSEGKMYFRYMVPFITEQSCLKCHAFQGYKVGDIRGAISIVTDVDDIEAGERSVEYSVIAGYTILWAIVMLLLKLVYSGISRMLKRIDDTEQEKNAFHTRNTTILESTGECIFGVDSDGNITFINHAVKQNSGYMEHELIGHSHVILAHGANDNDAEEHDCIIMKTLRDGMNRTSVETFTRKDGSIYTCSLFAAPLIEDSILTGAVVSYYDITESMKKEKALTDALNEKNMLLNELHHRVKNNLQIVSGILSMQAESAQEGNANTEELLKNAQARVMSMSLIHECLYKSKDITTINMKDYLTSLIEYYKSAFISECAPIDFVIDVHNVSIDNSKTVTCGILINEIITNSIKHAFKETESPQIKISIYEQGNEVILTIADNGTGLDIEKSKNSGSLGMMLIDSLTEQLYGALSVSVKGGTKYTVTFPLKHKN